MHWWRIASMHSCRNWPRISNGGFGMSPHLRVDKNEHRMYTICACLSMRNNAHHEETHKQCTHIHRSCLLVYATQQWGAQNNNSRSYQRATPFPPVKEIFSVKASSPQFWGEIIFQRVSCSTHTQLFRPMSWGHHILEWWTTENTCGASIYHRFHPRASWIHTCLSCSLPVFHPAGGRPAPSLKFQKRIGIEMIKSWAGPAFRIFGSFSGSQEQTPSIRLLICNGDPQRILRGREDAYQWTTIKAMLAWFIFANVCDSLGNSEVSLSVNDDQGDASMIRLRQCV